MSTRLAVVTGAAGGIGSATVDAFRREGWDVIGVDVVEARTSNASDWWRVDLAEGDAIREAFAGVQGVRAIDALVNNAATMVNADIAELTARDWDGVMGVNLRAAFIATSAAVPSMVGGGAIVNVSSVHATATAKGAAAYAAAKAGLLGLTRASALDLAGRGIRVNAVLPGAVDTPMLHLGDRDSSRVAELIARTPLARVGDPREVAEAVLFLADDQRSSFITGQTLTVDGGALARLSTE